MRLIILGHIIGDFYLQTDRIASKKKNLMRYMILHCVIYTLLMTIVILLLSNSIIHTLQASGVIFVSHLIIDILKKYLDKWKEKSTYLFFILYQVLHIMLLSLIYYFFVSRIHSGLYTIDTVLDIDIGKCILVIIAVLVCWKPAAIFVSLIFKKIPETIELADENIIKSGQTQVNKGVEKENEEKKSIDSEGVKIGSWIGVLEREIILILGLLGQYGAIGFVLTAKSLARFKQLENKSFAEKYLVGTLLSALIAILCIVICSI